MSKLMVIVGEDSWSIVRNHLLKELGKWRDEYIVLLGEIERYEQLKRSLFVDGLGMVYNFTFYPHEYKFMIVVVIKFVMSR